MKDKQSGILTFHKVREDCEHGNPEAWRAFLRLYTPLGFSFMSLYLPPGSPEPKRVWEQFIAAFTADNFEPLRHTARQSEREFLADVRSLLLDTMTASAQGQAGDEAPVASAPDTGFAAKLPKLLEDLPLLHQEMLFLKVAGYSDAAIEQMLRMAPRVAQAAFARLEPEYSAALQSTTDRCRWPAEWLAMLHEARAAKTDKCPQLHQFMRVHDGQVSWYDKEPVERHVTGCLHCLEAWTALHEVGFWRRAAPALTDQEIEEFLRGVPVQATAKKSFFRRVFS